MNKILSLFMCLVIFPSLVMAQGKKPLTHDVYDQWKSLGSTSLSNDGNWLHFTINPQEGDNVLEVKQLNGTASYKIDRAVNPNFTNDNRFVVFVIKPQSALVKEQKLKKVKAADMPKDTLGILNLENGNLVKKPMVKGYKLSKDGSGWLVYQTEPGANKAEGTEEANGDEKAKKPAPKAKGSELVLRNLATGEEQIVERTAEYIITEPGNRVYFTKVEDDSVKNAGVWYFDTQSKALAAIDTGLTEYKGITAYKDGLKLGWHATADSTKAKEKYFSLFYWDNAAKQSRKLVDTLTQGMPAKWLVKDNGNINFSDNGNRIFFGTAPRPPKYDYEQDTTILDEDRVKVDVWSWTDDAIQPMQQVQLNRELRRTYLAVYQLNSNKMIQLEDLDFNSISLDPDRKFDIAIATDDSKYRYNSSWDIQLPRDVYTVDLNTGARKMIFTAQGYPQASPNGKYLAWYEPTDSTWYSYTIASGAKKALTKNVDVNFYDEIHDSPSLPSGYGSAGWLADESGILVYDRHDIWKLDPTMAKAPENLTNGHGRANDLRYRYTRLDFEERSIPTSGKWYLSTFHYTNKQSGYSSINANSKANPASIVMGDYAMSGMRKAKNSDRVIFNRSTFTEYGEVYATNLQFENPRKMSVTNPQQSEYNWGTIELVEYTSLQGDRLQGLLIKPENFDPNKKYPLISYFYERSSDGLHSYRAPAPSASTINLTYFASNGYVVFVPDIKYDLGLPGPSAYDCIVPGVLSIVDRGFIDKDNIALQGQSWGGYQVAYIVTKTNMFKAAGSGAPVVNMTSAYGGIRWGTGMSRMFQYEQTQSRIGGTLWEKPWYYVENSPLFYADRIKTPLLIMSNDEDGAVPWYQGIEFYMALRRNNVPSWLLVYNGEDHNLVQRKNRKDLSVRLSQFFDHYLKGEPMPHWMKYGIPATEKGKTMRYELTED
jgi:dipeptidyl aminopeptidase/acylaminoacyl peptidase